MLALVVLRNYNAARAVQDERRKWSEKRRERPALRGEEARSQQAADIEPCGRPVHWRARWPTSTPSFIACWADRGSVDAFRRRAPPLCLAALITGVPQRGGGALGCPGVRGRAKLPSLHRARFAKRGEPGRCLLLSKLGRLAKSTHRGTK